MRSAWKLLLRSCVAALVLVGGALSAQPVTASFTASFTTSPQSVAQIADAALDAVLTPEFSRNTSIKEESLRFDRERTMTAFGAVDDPTVPLAALGFRRNVGIGSRDMLDGCSQVGVGECRKMGHSTYVHLEPVSMNDTTAVVWLYFAWAGRVRQRVFLSGRGSEVHLSRTGTGPWKFVRFGRSIMS